jgi:hypothetical protein
MVPSRSGQGVKILNELKKAGISLLAFSGFPTRGGKSQIDLVATSMGPVLKVARKNGWRPSKVKRGFLVQGRDEPGAAGKVLAKLAEKNINVVAADAVAAGMGRYGMILWVNPKKYAAAARALNAK